tara:strand:- start:1709 stop:1882 length:174 start_codon:yes stop_codon:yes gene_type:complete
MSSAAPSSVSGEEIDRSMKKVVERDTEISQNLSKVGKHCRDRTKGPLGNPSGPNFIN